MSYLLDTDEVVNYLRARQPHATRVGLLVETQERLFISLMTYFEIYDGIYRGTNPESAEAGFLGLLQRVHVLSMDKELMRLAARIRGQLETGGRRIGTRTSSLARRQYILIFRSSRATCATSSVSRVYESSPVT